MVTFVGLIPFFILLAVSFGIQPSAFAGEIKGVVRYEGQVPPLPRIDMAKEPVCHEMHREDPRTADFLVLGEGQTLANAVIHVVSGAPAKDHPVPEGPFEISQKGCMYAPHVMGIRVGQRVDILNPDGILHNIHFYPSKNPEFNRSMQKDHAKISHTFRVAEPAFVVKCEVHTWMKAYCWVFDHPYFAVTGRDGRFVISGLDPGGYEIEVWHETFQTRRQKVVMSESGSEELEIVFTRNDRAPFPENRR